MTNHFTPPNISDFFSSLSANELFQGDIVSARDIGLKDENDDETFPDFYMIITKTCDLSFDDNHIQKTRSGIISLIPLFNIKLLNPILLRFLKKNILAPTRKVNLIPVVKLINAFSGQKIEKIDSIVKNQISKFMFLPPDGNILTEPMVIDFESFSQIDGESSIEVGRLLLAKKIQLTSPFRELIAQRFASHYSNIGINDQHIKQKEYVIKIKELLKKHNEKLPR